MNTLIRKLVRGLKLASPDQLRQIIEHVANAPFASALLEVDKALWGSFWHYDVITPGYLVPAIELALLRAIRLDRYWPEETSVERFASDLTLRYLPGVSHWVQEEAPGVVNTMLEAWLTGRPVPQASEVAA